MTPRYIAPLPVVRVLGLFALAGVVPALMVDGLAQLAGVLGLDSRWGTVVSVNVLIPLCFGLAVGWYPRLRLLPLESLAALVGYALAGVLRHEWRVWHWTPAHFDDVLHPIVVAAFMVATLLGVVIAAGLRPYRRVGVDPRVRCPACAYSIAGLGPGARCPECGYSPGASAS